mmetsp:Transcript_14903/g.58413  ORF Transcript_14903/g.58413 Transcript_14903/m.58413 type:complete len:258 (+) Transcript_14903:1435-2208(+)
MLMMRSMLSTMTSQKTSTSEREGATRSRCLRMAASLRLASFSSHVADIFMMPLTSLSRYLRSTSVCGATSENMSTSSSSSPLPGQPPGEPGSRGADSARDKASALEAATVVPLVVCPPSSSVSLLSFFGGKSSGRMGWSVSMDPRRMSMEGRRCSLFLSRMSMFSRITSDAPPGARRRLALRRTYGRTLSESSSSRCGSSRCRFGSSTPKCGRMAPRTSGLFSRRPMWSRISGNASFTSSKCGPREASSWGSRRPPM